MCESMSGVYSATYWLLAGMEEIRLGSLFLRATNAEDALREAGRRNTSDVANYVSVSCDGEEVAASPLASPPGPSAPALGAAGGRRSPYGPLQRAYRASCR